MKQFVFKEKQTRPDKDIACKNCRWLQGAVSLWCVNSDAVNDRKTHVVGVKDCVHWQPAPCYDDIVKQHQSHSWFRSFFNCKPNLECSDYILIE